jgi:hypothetical protein
MWTEENRRSVKNVDRGKLKDNSGKNVDRGKLRRNSFKNVHRENLKENSVKIRKEHKIEGEFC